MDKKCFLFMLIRLSVDGLNFKNFQFNQCSTCIFTICSVAHADNFIFMPPSKKRGHIALHMSVGL